MQVFSKIDIGKVRKTNQDAFKTDMLSDNSVFAVVCDGMGGAKGGNVASVKAVDIITQYVKRSFSEKMSLSERADLLQKAVTSANIEIFESSLENEDLRGMGTTVVCSIASESGVAVCHVGDSRAYKIGDTVAQITRDHSVVQNLIESGELTPEEARKHPKKNIITRALGVEYDIISDVSTVDFSKGESLMLCTDGLTNFVDTDQITNSFKETDISRVAELLTEKANENGGGDNITVVVIYNG